VSPTDVAIYQQVPIQDIDFVVTDEYISMTTTSSRVVDIGFWHISDNLERSIFEFKNLAVKLNPLSEIKILSPNAKASSGDLQWTNRSNSWASNNYDFTVFYWLRHSATYSNQTRSGSTVSGSGGGNDPKHEGPTGSSKKKK